MNYILWYNIIIQLEVGKYLPIQFERYVIANIGNMSSRFINRHYITYVFYIIYHSFVEYNFKFH